MIQNQDTLKQSDVEIKQLLLDLRPDLKTPQTQEEYEQGKKLFEEKSQRLETLEKQIDLANTDLNITKDSLEILKKQFHNFKEELQKDLEVLGLAFKEIKQKNEKRLEDVFEYGYATYIIDANKESRLIQTYNVDTNKISVDWNSMKWAVNEKTLSVLANLTFKEFYITYNEHTSIIKRDYDDLGRIYKSSFTSPTISLGVGILTDDSRGILVVIGFFPKKTSVETTKKS